MPRGKKSRLVHNVSEIRAHETRRLRGNLGKVHGRRQFNLLGVQAENFLPPFDVGTVDQHLPVESPWAQQRGIENLRPVRRGHDNDALVRIKTIHFRQQLIERLLPLIMARQQVHSSGFTQRVQLVDENDAGRVFNRLAEKISHSRRAHAHEHFDEVRSGDAEKRHPGFARDRSSEQRLTGARRTN